MTLSHHEIERLLARVASGTTTARDAQRLREIFREISTTDTVAAEKPQR